MANQSHTNNSVNSDLPSSNAAAINIIPNSLASSRLQTDEVIGSLVNAYENQRARQVVEWEKLFRRNASDPKQGMFL